MLPGGLKTWFISLTPVWDRGKIKYIVGSQKDIALQIMTEEKMRKNIRYEELVSRISRLALQERDKEVFMQELAGIIGEGTGVSRVYIFERNAARETMSSFYEWKVPGIKSYRNILQDLPESEFPWWVNTMKNNDIINYKDIELIPDMKARELLKINEVRSMLALPLHIDGEYYGFIVLDECLRNRVWEEDEVKLLVVVKEIIQLYLMQKKREDMLWLENQRFKALVNSTDNIIYELDREMKVAGIYGRWMDILGVNREQFLGKNVREIFGPENAIVHEEANKKALKGEHTVYEWSYHWDGETLHIQTSVSPLIGKKDEDSSITGVVGIGRDITLLINIQEELRKKGTVRTTLLSMGDGVVTTDRESRITMMNKMAEEITKWSMKKQG